MGTSSTVCDVSGSNHRHWLCGFSQSVIQTTEARSLHDKKQTNKHSINSHWYRFFPDPYATAHVLTEETKISYPAMLVIRSLDFCCLAFAFLIHYMNSYLYILIFCNLTFYSPLVQQSNNWADYYKQGIGRYLFLQTVVRSDKKNTCDWFFLHLRLQYTQYNLLVLCYSRSQNTVINYMYWVIAELLLCSRYTKYQVCPPDMNSAWIFQVWCRGS